MPAWPFFCPRYGPFLANYTRLIHSIRYLFWTHSKIKSPIKKKKTLSKYLAIGANPDVADDGRVCGGQGLLYGQVGQRVLAEDRASVQVGSHVVAETCQKQGN